MTATFTTHDCQKWTPKSFAKQWMGAAIAVTSPDRSAELVRSPTSRPSGLRERLIMAHLKQRAIRDHHTDWLERLHADFWQGESGTVFAKNCGHRFEDLFLAKQKRDFRALQKSWATQPREHLVEFGCSSGRLLQYFTSELSGIQTSVGIDINSDQVQQNQASSCFDSRIQFVNADGADWVLENGQPETLFVSNGGVLEYFRRERLERMLSHIANHLGPATFFSVEPVASDHDWTNNTDSIPFGEELSFSHNYRHLFESNGFRVLHQRAVNFESWKMMATVATTR